MPQRLVRPWIFTAAFAVAAWSFSAQSASLDPLIEGAKQCTKYLPRYEREYAIPTHLLSAIASTESGRYHDGLKIKVPWPWTINVEGKGYFYDTKEQAVAAARRFKQQGVQSMDIGCMQVNIYHHPNAFSSLDEAFEPQNNVAYAASFLSNLYQEEHSWKKAAADYHSRTPSLGSEYVGLVFNSWYQIVDKLRMARLQVPENTMAEISHGPAITSVSTSQASGVKIAGLDSKKTPAHKSAVHMNSIKVSSHEDRTRDNGIIVVRPDIKVANDKPAATPMTVANAQPVSLETVTPISDAKVIHLDGTRVVTTPETPKPAGPHFIFN